MVEVAWARLKAHELRARVAAGAAVILPLGATEQHGPHLPVMTDCRIGEEIAHRAAAKAAAAGRDALVAPMLWAGLSEHHMVFGGTFTLQPETFQAMIADLLGSLARLGVRDVLLSNSHGGNIRAMHAAAETAAQRLGIAIVATTYAAEAADEIAALLEDQPSLMHAEEAETSMMLALEPDLVDTGDLAGLADGMTAEGGRGALSAGKASFRWRPFEHITTNGVRGNPARATAEKGERMLEVSAEALAALLLDPALWAPATDLRGTGTSGVPFGRS
ncbi:MAG: creatininase family protein [Pseudomonadota bacterium]